MTKHAKSDIVWPSPFEKRRRIVLGSSMMAING